MGKIQTGRKKGDQDIPSIGSGISAIKTTVHRTGSQCRHLAKTEGSCGK